jgi:hypothetical protein
MSVIPSRVEWVVVECQLIYPFSHTGLDDYLDIQFDHQGALIVLILTGSLECFTRA